MQGADGVPELGFKTKKIAREFVKTTSILSVIYREDRTRYSMQLFADILKNLSSANLIQKSDLYKMTEDEIIGIVKNSEYSNTFDNWRSAKKVKISNSRPEKVYSIRHPAKVRYVDPLCQGTRMSESCQLAKQMIDKNLSYDMSKYVYLDNVII